MKHHILTTWIALLVCVVLSSCANNRKQNVKTNSISTILSTTIGATHGTTDSQQIFFDRTANDIKIQWAEFMFGAEFLTRTHLGLRTQIGFARLYQASAGIALTKKNFLVTEALLTWHPFHDSLKNDFELFAGPKLVYGSQGEMWLGKAGVSLRAINQHGFAVIFEPSVMVNNCSQWIGGSFGFSFY